MLRLKLEPREKSSTLFELYVIITSVLLAVVAMSIVLIIEGKDPFYAYKMMVLWAFTNPIGLQGTLIKFTPLAIIGLGLVVAFRMKLWNIGGEGQFYLGAIGSTYIALYLMPDAPAYILIPVAIIVGSLAGAMWGAIPGILKAFIGADEIVVTLMLNYIGILWSDYLVYGPWKNPKGFNFPMTAILGENAFLPILWGNVHIGVIFPIAIAIVLWWILKRSRWGYELKVIGDNPDVARYAGMNVKKMIVVVMMISGLMGGFAGSVQILGLQHRLQHGFSPGYGYTAIIVAWLSRLNPFTTILVAFLMGGLFVGTEILQILMKLPISATYIFQGLLFVSVLIGEIFIRYRIKAVRISAHGGVRDDRRYPNSSS